MLTGTAMTLALDEELPSVDGVFSTLFSSVALAGTFSPDNGIVQEPTFVFPNMPWSYRSITSTAFPSCTCRSSAVSLSVAFHVGFKFPFLFIGDDTFWLGYIHATQYTVIFPKAFTFFRFWAESSVTDISRCSISIAAIPHHENPQINETLRNSFVADGCASY